MTCPLTRPMWAFLVLDRGSDRDDGKGRCNEPNRAPHWTRSGRRGREVQSTRRVTAATAAAAVKHRFSARSNVIATYSNLFNMSANSSAPGLCETERCSCSLLCAFTIYILTSTNMQQATYRMISRTSHISIGTLVVYTKRRTACECGRASSLMCSPLAAACLVRTRALRPAGAISTRSPPDFLWDGARPQEEHLSGRARAQHCRA
jgi:hypothetical protein